MKNAILIHGRADKKEFNNPDIPSGSNFHWFPWLQKQLLIAGFEVQTPEIPRPYEITFEKWSEIVERNPINENTTLVGHSKGGGFLVRWLSEHPEIYVDKVILVAPWIDPDKIDGNFFDFDLDKNLASRCNKLMLLSSSDDMDSVQESIRIIRSKVEGVKNISFNNYGHFTLNSMKTEKFPELLVECINE